MASYVIDWHQFLNKDDQCPLSFLCSTEKYNREQEAIHTDTSKLKTEYEVYGSYKNDLEPLIEIAKLATQELNLQLIDGWLSPRMMQVFMHVAEIYHKQLAFDYANEIYFDQDTVPIEDITSADRNYCKYWPLEMTKAGSNVHENFILGWITIFKTIMKLTQKNIAPTKSNIMKELNLSDHITNLITLNEDNRNVQILMSSKVMVHSLHPNIDKLIESKSLVMAELIEKVSAVIPTITTALKHHEQFILDYYKTASVDHAINLLIDIACDCHEKRSVKGVEFNPLLEELIPIIKKDQKMKILPETKLDFEWYYYKTYLSIILL